MTMPHSSSSLFAFPLLLSFSLLLLLLSYGHFLPRSTYLVTLCGIDPLSPYLHYDPCPLHSGGSMGTSNELGFVCSRFWLGTLRIDLILITQLLRDFVPISAYLSTSCRLPYLLVDLP